MGGGFNAAQQLYQMGQQQHAQQAVTAAPAANSWKCKCGAVNTGKFCGECGKSIVVGIVCPKCGKVNGTGQKFCGDCGERLSKKCPNCGKDNELSQKFCGDCGTKL